MPLDRYEMALGLTVARDEMVGRPGERDMKNVCKDYAPKVKVGKTGRPACKKCGEYVSVGDHGAIVSPRWPYLLSQGYFCSECCKMLKKDCETDGHYLCNQCIFKKQS